MPDDDKGPTKNKTTTATPAETPPAVTTATIDALRAELQRELGDQLARAMSHLEQLVVDRLAQLGELHSDEPIPQVLCTNAGCGVVLIGGVCPRCSPRPRAVPTPVRQSSGQCAISGCGCMLDARGLCPRHYPATAPTS